MVKHSSVLTMPPNSESIVASEAVPRDSVRAIAFYLPQYHPVPENDAWWGRGFTEWANVAKTRPRFPGHYQPHLPADLGFYDLRLPEARAAQADLAREYGVHGFCYYHYWFNGRRILERPFTEVLASGEPDFPFCLCWANENWTKRWDGQDKEVLLAQNYSPEDDLAHIQSLFPAFEDPRYIRVNGKPLFLVYHTQHLPNAAHTAEVWREAALRAGIGDLYLVRVESHHVGINPETIGFDAGVEFGPELGYLGTPLGRRQRHRLMQKLGLLPQAYAENFVHDYQGVVDRMLNKPKPDYKRFLGVVPSWDNSARRASAAHILIGATPEKYEDWLRQAIAKTDHRFEGDERLIFINAWNEWGEGCHLEPDQKQGHGYLEATQRALLSRVNAQ